ncbi:hypothetical protein AMELA_G00251620 [Ameiurus melas]|uniref:Uncharacterized protein n=1 Tax=Ameiurus melas TaxID=219545 RepID=A0A7J5ZQP5_AMEME|nr:hypothetical protein AMELA_G00251620 [Ameiurus melas]
MERIVKQMEKVEYPSKHNDETSEDPSSEYSDGSSGDESLADMEEEEEEEEEDTTEQLCVFNRPQEPEQLYTEEQMNRFLNVTKGKRNITRTEFFPDRRTFINSVQCTMGVTSPRRRPD